MIEVRLDDLSSGHVIDLLNEHRREMFKHSPPESVHALDHAALHSPAITFWSAWLARDFAGCGALKMIDSTHAEIKSMKTASNFGRKGVGSSVLIRILEFAKLQGYQRVSLETGTAEAFIAARYLYEKFGFSVCGPFADYFKDPNSVFMTLELIGE